MRTGYGGLTALSPSGLLALALLVAACGGTAEAPTMDGPPAEDTPSDGAGAEERLDVTPAAGDEGPFVLTADAFSEGETIPERFSCHGEDISPALSWSGPPAGTVAFALIMDDPDAAGPTFVHWVVYDVPVTTRDLEEGIPATAQVGGDGAQGRNDFGRSGYGGPCPPPGETHRYDFTLYALDEPLGLDPGATKLEMLQAAEGHILDEASLQGVYP